jgi:propanediol dehydratase large subunit
MPLSVLAMARAYKRRGMAVVGVIVEILLAVLVAGSFAIRGAHAILSGVAGAPSSLHNTGALEWFGILGLIALGVLWQRKSLAVTAACIFLIGGTDLGRLLAAFVIAPMFAAGVSHDTTPWTETVVAASAAAAGVAMLFTAAAALPRAPRGQGHVDDVRLASGGAT